MSIKGGRQHVEVGFLGAASHGDTVLAGEVASLVNEVYAVAEKGLWVEGTARTTTEEISELIAVGQIALAQLEECIVGCVRIQVLDEDRGEFGMLVTAPSHRGLGIGRELVSFAERQCAERGMRAVQLELLVPQRWMHPTKEFLHSWYTRIGYRVVGHGRLAEDYPRLAPLLATACDYRIYEKPLDGRRNG